MVTLHIVRVLSQTCRSSYPFSPQKMSTFEAKRPKGPSQISKDPPPCFSQTAVTSSDRRLNGLGPGVFCLYEPHRFITHYFRVNPFISSAKKVPNNHSLSRRQGVPCLCSSSTPGMEKKSAITCQKNVEQVIPWFLWSYMGQVLSSNGFAKLLVLMAGPTSHPLAKGQKNKTLQISTVFGKKIFLSPIGSFGGARYF